MTPYYTDDTVTLHHGDCLDVLRELADNSVDAVVTDPPYGLEFMGKDWDAPWKGKASREFNTIEPGSMGGFTKLPNHARVNNLKCLECDRWKFSSNPCTCEAPRFPNARRDAMVDFQDWCLLWAIECLRVLKPGGHLLAFGGSRTWHRLASAIEDAGFEMRDSIAWLYGSGFPKSLDVSKAIDKAARGVPQGGADPTSPHHGQYRTTTTEGKRWETDKGQGYGAGGSRFLASTVSERATAPSTLGTSAPTAVAVDSQPSRMAGATATDAERWQGWGTALKPSHEPVCVAVKPHAVSDILDSIGSHIDRLESEWKHTANVAGKSSKPSRAASPEVMTDSVPEPVVTQPADDPVRPTATGAAGDSSEAMDTSVSEWTVEMFSNIVTSWRACLVALSELTSTSTTSTASRPTTDLRTLWSLIASLMVTSMPGKLNPTLTGLCHVSVVDDLFTATVLSSRATHALSARGSATEQTPASPQVGDARGSNHFEPIVVARKPLAGTVAANVLAWGTGALNIDGCRVPATPGDVASVKGTKRSGGIMGAAAPRDIASEPHDGGRWPTNVVLDESQAEVLDGQAPKTGGAGKASGPSLTGKTDASVAYGARNGLAAEPAFYGDSGGASRFFPTFRYEAKAPTSERPREDDNAHPTVKPLDLMRWLVRLVTPPGGTVLEPFAGSGTTAEACVIEGFRCIAIEREDTYLPLIVQRLTKPIQTALDFGEVA